MISIKIELLEFDYAIWNHLTVWKRMNYVEYNCRIR